MNIKDVIFNISEGRVISYNDKYIVLSEDTCIYVDKYMRKDCVVYLNIGHENDASKMTAVRLNIGQKILKFFLVKKNSKQLMFILKCLSLGYRIAKEHPSINPSEPVLYMTDKGLTLAQDELIQEIYFMPISAFYDYEDYKVIS